MSRTQTIQTRKIVEQYYTLMGRTYSSVRADGTKRIKFPISVHHKNVESVYNQITMTELSKMESALRELYGDRYISSDEESTYSFTGYAYRSLIVLVKI